MTFYDLEDLRRHRARKEKQRAYAQAHRATLKARRAPERDDVAAAALTVLLERLAIDHRSLGQVPGEIVLAMEAKGFSREEAGAKLRTLVRRARDRVRDRLR